MKKLVLPIMLLLSIGSMDAMWYRKGGRPVARTVQSAQSPAAAAQEVAVTEEIPAATTTAEVQTAEVTFEAPAPAKEPLELQDIKPGESIEIQAPAPVAKQPVRLIPVTKPVAAAPAASVQERVLMWTALPEINVPEAASEDEPAVQAPVAKQVASPLNLKLLRKPAPAPAPARAAAAIVKQSVITKPEEGPYDSAKLARAIARGDVATVRAALEAGVNAADTFKLPAFAGLTPLALAFKQNVPNKLEIAELLLVNGANAADLKPYLAQAIKARRASEVEWLRNFGVEDK